MQSKQKSVFGFGAGLLMLCFFHRLSQTDGVEKRADVRLRPTAHDLRGPLEDTRQQRRELVMDTCLMRLMCEVLLVRDLNQLTLVWPASCRKTTEEEFIWCQRH